MLYGFVRFFAAGIVFVVCAILIMYSKPILRPRKYAVAIGACLLLWVILGFIPFENAFFTFSSPESAYRYAYSGDPVLTVNGRDTDLVIAEESSNSHNIEIIPKTKDGWKIGLGIDLQCVSDFSDDISVTVYQHRKSKDCYIVVDVVDDGLLELSDSQNSQFYKLDVPVEENYGLPTSFYAFIERPDRDYCVYLNGIAHTFEGLTLGQ